MTVFQGTLEEVGGGTDIQAEEKQHKQRNRTRHLWPIWTTSQSSARLKLGI